MPGDGDDAEREQRVRDLSAATLAAAAPVLSLARGQRFVDTC